LLVYTQPVSFPGRGLVVPVALALYLLGGVPARAHASDGEGRGTGAEASGAQARARAQDLLQQGNEHFRAGRFAEAMRAYREAHQLFPSPKLLFNIARCEENLGHRSQAMVNLRGFLKLAPEADPAIRAEAEQRTAELARVLAGVDVSALPPNAAVAVDGQGVGLTPLDQVLWLEPGVHRLTVERAGKPLWVTGLEGKAGATVALRIPEADSLPQPPLPAGDTGHEAPPAPPAPAGHSRWWIWVGLGLVVAGAATVVTIKLLECPATKCM
jgi:tetratricopeptide (TPR) repeat protein